MAPFINAIPDPIRGQVYLETNWTDTPSVTHIRILRIRSDTGEFEVVRTNTSVDSSGTYMELSGGVAILYDNEAPFNVAIHYRVDGLGSSLTATTSPDLVLAESGLWLKDPLRPFRNIPVGLRGSIDPRCIAGRGTYFSAMDMETHDGRGSLNTVLGARLPIPVSQPRGGINSTLTLVTRTFLDRDALIDMLRPGSPLLLQAPAEYGIADRYLHVPSGVGISRLTDDHRRQWRVANLPHTQVARIAGLSYGAAGTRWADLCPSAMTFADATSAGIRWERILQGGAAEPGLGVGTGWRTYNDVNAEFPTYVSIGFGGRTYNQLLQGV